MMQIPEQEIIAVFSAHATSISLTVPPFAEFCNQAVSLMLELTILAPSSEAQILLQRSIATAGYHTINHE